MLVLTIIGVLVGLFIVAMFITGSNEHALIKYGYEIFNYANFIVSVIGYVLIFFGYKWLMDDISNGGDTLNGAVLIGVGAIFLIYVVYTNIKNTSFIYGIVYTVFQTIIYIPSSYFAVIAVIMAIAFFSNTRPVYNLNR